MFDIHISQVIVLHSEEQGFLFCCLFCVQAAIWIWLFYFIMILDNMGMHNSISVFIHLPGWPFHLNYGLRLSITLYFWFCNYSPLSDISALQCWVEYVTLRLIWVKVIYSQLGYSAGMFQSLQHIALVVFDAVNWKPLIPPVRKWFVWKSSLNNRSSAYVWRNR